jgi:DNA-directed RNA polymerase subunit H (RpoH/RPB5)
MSTSTKENLISRIYKSRTVLLQQLEMQGYSCDDYKYFSSNEIYTMVKNNQLDMLITRESNAPTGKESKLYIKYMLEEKQLRPQILDKLVEDLFELEEVLTDKTTDSIVVVCNEEPNETMQKKMQYMFDRNGYFVVLHNIHRLQFNVLEHQMVPDCKILSETDIQELMEKYNIKDVRNLPEISRFDPQALAMTLRPGKIMQFMRKSMTAMETPYYRICI